MTLLSWQLGYTTLLSGLYSIYLWWWGSCASVLSLERKYGKSNEILFLEYVCPGDAEVVNLGCSYLAGTGGRRGENRGRYRLMEGGGGERD